MSATLLIARHEWRRLAVQPFAWILAAIVVALMGWEFLLALGAWFELQSKLAGLANAPGVTDLVAIPLLRSFSQLLVLIVPLVTMRAFAGERHQHTLPFLLSAGIGDAALVSGKFIGAFGYLALLVGFVVLMPITLGFGTTLDTGKLATALAGLLLYAAALTGIGVLCSAWTSHPSLAAAVALAITTLLSLIDAGARYEGVTNDAINYLALPTHLEPFFNGIVASVDAAYFLLLALLALALAVRRLDVLRSRPA
ncbi:MAG: ABC transporter permease subunit [Lysobacterales bacterium]